MNIFEIAFETIFGIMNVAVEEQSLTWAVGISNVLAVISRNWLEEIFEGVKDDFGLPVKSLSTLKVIGTVIKP